MTVAAWLPAAQPRHWEKGKNQNGAVIHCSEQCDRAEGDSKSIPLLDHPGFHRRTLSGQGAASPLDPGQRQGCPWNEPSGAWPPDTPRLQGRAALKIPAQGVLPLDAAMDIPFRLTRFLCPFPGQTEGVPTGCLLGSRQVIFAADLFVRWRPAKRLSAAVHKSCSELACRHDCHSNDMKFFKTKPSPKTAPYHPQTVIRDWGNGDAFRLADAQTGVIVFGATGSGKTSGPAKHLAYGYLAAGFGGLVLCGKKDEAPMWLQWAAETGRAKDVVIVNAQGDWRYSFLDWEASRPGEGGGFTINVVAFLDEVGGNIAGGEKTDGGGDQKFWEQALHNLNSNLVDLPVLAGLKVSLPLLRDIASSAAQSVEQVNDPRWQQNSLCYQILKEADKATEKADPEARADFDECNTYWTKNFPALAEKTRSSIMIGFTVLIHPLVTRPLRKLFSSDTNIKPEDTFDGKIIIVDLPVQEFRLAGRIANLTWKYCFQIAVLRRMQPKDGFLRPVFLWADEAQNFVSKFDSEYQAVARSAGGCTVYLTQNRESLRRVLNNDDAVDSLLGNLQAKFFCQNTGETNFWASGLLGQRYVNITSTSAGLSRQAQVLLLPGSQANENAGISRAQDKRFYVEPAVFTTLKRGGQDFNFQVEAIVYNGGHLFGNGSEERLPFKLLKFNQR